jgi:predicted secreted protein
MAMKTAQKSMLRSLLQCSASAIIISLGVDAAHAAYPDLILSNNPVAYYRLEEIAGSTAFDATSNHFDATYIVNAGYPQLGLPGITTNSVLFQNVPATGSILIPYRPELSPTNSDGQTGAPFSAECWVQATSTPSDYAVPLSMFGAYELNPPYVNASGWNFYQSAPSAGNTFWVFNLKNGAFLTASPAITLLRWYHLAATFDGSNAVFYVNGVSNVSAGGINSYLANHNADGQIGAGVTTGFQPFSGGVDEVAFYTNLLSPAQILAHYQLGTNSFRAVPTPPGILTQPVSRTNFSGTVATFNVIAGGTAPLAYQWKRGGSPITGATNSAYSLTATYPADDGATFSVTITNSVGSTNSDVVTLTVLTNLNIIHNPFGPITRNIGSKAAFRVVANGAIPITYQWFKGTQPIAGATKDTLWVNNVQLADATNYYVHVTGPFTAADSATAALVVQTRPVTVPVAGYARIVVADDPVAYWRLDETNGSVTAVDAVGSFDGQYQANAGTLVYGAASGIPHETNAAISISGGSVVTIPYALELNPVTGPWSFEAWIRPASLDPGHFRTPFSSMWNSDFGGHLFGWNIYQHVAGVWTLNAYNGGPGGSFTSDFVHNPINTNTWYHMVIADDLTFIRYYVNGVLVVTINRNNFGFVANGLNGDVTVAGAPTVLGQRSDNAFDPFDGYIDEAAAYNYALTLAQAQNHFFNTARLTVVKSGNNVVLSWPVGTLQSAPIVSGTYTNVPGATSPYTNGISGSQKYFRLQL